MMKAMSIVFIRRLLFLIPLWLYKDVFDPIRAIEPYQNLISFVYPCVDLLRIRALEAHGKDLVHLAGVFVVIVGHFGGSGNGIQCVGFSGSLPQQCPEFHLSMYPGWY